MAVFSGVSALSGKIYGIKTLKRQDEDGKN
jgi:hypothetical protein